MSDALSSALIPGAGTIAGAFLAYLGVRFTARQSTKAKALEVDLEQNKIRAFAYADAQGYYRELATDLRKEIAGVRAEQEQDRQRYRQEIADLREERRQQMVAFNARIDELEAKHDDDRKLIQSLTEYIRALLRLLRDHGVVPPPAPPGLYFDD